MFSFKIKFLVNLAGAQTYIIQTGLKKNSLDIFVNNGQIKYRMFQSYVL